jgi:hypothetical protein
MKKFLTSFAILLFLSSCSSLKVNYDYDHSVDFNQFKSFSFYPWDYKNGFQINEYDKETILMTIKSEMEKKGYKYQKSGGERAISIFLTIEGKTNYKAYINHYNGWAGYGGGWGYSGFGYGYGYGPGYSITKVTKSQYDQGTLVIDAFNMANKNLIWQGIASSEVEENLDKRDRKLPKNVSQILAKFPVSK